MRLELLLPCPPEDIWRALIRHAELGEDGPRLCLELPGAACAVAARIVIYDSHRILECACSAGIVRWQLQVTDGATRLIVTHQSTEPVCATADSRQWAGWLDSTVAALVAADA